MKRSRASGRQIIEADLTWTGTGFEEHVRVVVGADGRIEAVGKHLSADAADDTLLCLRGRALLPGFVNAHSHAFQRGLRGLGETYPARLGLPRSPSSNRNPFGGTSFPQYRARTHRIRALERTTCARAPSVMGASAFTLARSSAESTSVS